jgi:predicted nuclease of predicted toxin-antitoxin system
MKILLDENLDWRLERHLTGHTVTSISKVGWAGIKNGELLRRADGAFDVLVTMDKGIYHQQNLSQLKLAIVALKAKTNRLSDTAALMPALLVLLSTIQPGEFQTISE